MPQPYYEIPPGEYPAIAGGYRSHFTLAGVGVVTCRFNEAVKGMDIDDTITITSNGFLPASSKLLGLGWIEAIEPVEEIPTALPEAVTYTHTVQTIGSNTLKGAVWATAIDEHLALDQVLRANHIFVYDEIHPNLRAADLQADVDWLIAHGALSVSLSKGK